MQALDLLKSVILKTKTFKAFILLLLLFFCLYLQTSDSDNEFEVNIPEHEATKPLFTNSRSDDIFSSEKKEIKNSLNDLGKAVVQKVIENSMVESEDESAPPKQVKHFHSLLKNSVNILDFFVKNREDESYQHVKSMINMWNPESSQWAIQASRKYKLALSARSPIKPKDWYPEPEIDEEIKRKVTVDRCGCQRTIKAHTMEIYTNENISNKTISTCSLQSYYRGAKQKVVAFSFYGNPDSVQSKERKYFEGIKANLNQLPDLYPDWILRLYYDLPEDHYLMKDLCELACHNDKIDLCFIQEIPALGNVSKVFPMNWRFFPMLDPQVSHMVSRDLDSLLNKREVAAVNEWLESDKAFHFMRDHPAHGIEILGSGWGIRMAQLERSFVESAFITAVKDPMFWAPREGYGHDQGFLKRYIWPWGKWSAISHDSYSCQKFPRTQAFPTQRKVEMNNFIAAVISANDVLREPCPKRCRPKNHPDWEYC